MIAAAAGMAGLTWFNYRQMMPKPRPVLGKQYEVEIRKLPITAGGHRLYGELLLPKGASGRLPTLICSHGFNGSFRYFRGFTGMALAMAGYAVYCFDFYGGSMRSRSGGKMTEMSVFTERDELNNVIAAVKALDFVDPDRLYLFGESQGGLVTALTAALHNGDVKAIVLYYPAFCAKDDMLRHYPTPESLPDRPKLMGKTLGRIYYEKLYDIDLYTEAAKYTGPVLIIHGDADRVVDVSYGRKAAAAYRKARLEILHGQDHGFNAKGKEQAVRLVHDFLVTIQSRTETE